MPFLSVGEENSGAIDLHYEDHGQGKPVLLIHGWPLSGASWEKQTSALVEAGYRVIAYDRRGFGRSSKPMVGYDYDTLAGDLDKLIIKLDLRDASLVGFSMGGGEVARYMGRYGSRRIRKVVFMAAIPPYLLKTSDNPEGVDRSTFDGIRKGILDDRPAFLSGFFANFFNVDTLGGTRISDDAVRMCWNIAVQASPKGTLDCVQSWLTDFRRDLGRIDLPALIVHGDDDRIVPLAVSGSRTAQMVKGSRLAVVKGGSHGLNWTHADEVNRELLAFLKDS